jgi:hypothetical protein
MSNTDILTPANGVNTEERRHRRTLFLLRSIPPLTPFLRVESYDWGLSLSSGFDEKAEC